MIAPMTSKQMPYKDFDDIESIREFYRMVKAEAKITLYEEELLILVVIKLRFWTKVRMLLSSNFRTYKEHLLTQPARHITTGMSIKVIIEL